MGQSVVSAETAAIGKTYCNALAIQRGLDPVGTAGSFTDAIVIEVPLPWKRDMYQEAGALPQEMIDLLALWLQQYHEGKGYPHRPLMIAPEKAYALAGYRRVMFYTCASGAFAQFDKIEYLVPENQLGALVWALYEARETLAAFEQYRVPDADTSRDLLICTHGTIDAACAKFGYPLYRHLMNTYANETLRVWRVSHFGGHVFAPTLMDMPTGHYWAYVEAPQAEQIVFRNGDVAALRGNYRGWAGIEDSFVQAAERDLWQEHGWAWFDYLKCGEVLMQDSNQDNPQWAEAQIEYQLPDGGSGGMYEMRIEVKQHIETEISTGDTRMYSYPQYQVMQAVR